MMVNKESIVISLFGETLFSENIKVLSNVSEIEINSINLLKDFQ